MLQIPAIPGLTLAVLAELKSCDLNINAFCLFSRVFHFTWYIHLCDSANGLPCRSISSTRCITSATHTLGLIGFQAILLLTHQNRKYKVVHIAYYLPHLDIWPCIRKELGAFPDGDLISAPIDAKAVTELYSRVRVCLFNYLLRVYPL
jgi:hypothetical protein